jgi:preprotein translocase subunit Sec63
VGIVTIPLTYSVLKPSSDPGATAPRIKTDFQPEHADLIDAQRKAQKRRERKLKRGIAVVAGWATMALMAYLIFVTARTIPKIWNPYDILGLSDVSTLALCIREICSLQNSLPPRRKSNRITSASPLNSIRIRLDQIQQRIKRSKL